MLSSLLAKLRSFQPEVRVLMVCSANLCRSPMAHGMFQAHVDGADLGRVIEVDSAGLHVGPVGGQRPDPRAVQVCSRMGVDIARQRSREVRPEDFVSFDYIIAMDSSHQERLLELCPPAEQRRILAIAAYQSGPDQAGIPDPYFGPDAGFVRVFELLDQALPLLLADIEARRRA